MIKSLLISTAIGIGMELISLPIFWAIKRYFKETSVANENDNKKWLSVIKGSLERILIYFALINNVPTIVVMFGALKLGTRLADSSKNKISNDYFLVGNFLSVLIAVIAYSIQAAIIR